VTAAARLENVTKRFGAVRALDSVSFAAEPGSTLALLGANGAGKSTALAILLGLRWPDAGKATLFGLDPRRRASRLPVGVALQETSFPLTLRVRELVDLVRAHYRAPEPTSTLFGRFGLDELSGRQLGGLSGGERRRVAVALAFAGRPRLVVLDEPTAGLDRLARRAVWDAVHAHVAAGGTTVLTTHYLEEAEALATRVVVIDEGAIVADGAVASIKRAAGLARVTFRAPVDVDVEGATRDGPWLRILTADAGETVARLVRMEVELDDLEVRPLSLEEALAAWKARR
jgi:ABC-2 type transport system ATP-binding protein